MQPQTQAALSATSDAFMPPNGPAPGNQAPSITVKRKRVIETDSDDEIGTCG